MSLIQILLGLDGQTDFLAEKMKNQQVYSRLIKREHICLKKDVAKIMGLVKFLYVQKLRKNIKLFLEEQLIFFRGLVYWLNLKSINFRILASR